MCLRTLSLRCCRQRSLTTLVYRKLSLSVKSIAKPGAGITLTFAGDDSYTRFARILTHRAALSVDQIVAFARHGWWLVLQSVADQAQAVDAELEILA